jgi:membrane-associated protease RseP (regulator of RpoE activity)
VALTTAGSELFARVTPAHLANEERLLAALSGDERRLLTGLLRKLLVEFEGSQPTPAAGGRLGLVVSPAYVTIGMRATVGLPGVAGLLVRSVEPGSPAAQAKLRPGDVLTSASGRELRSSASLYAAIRDAGAGPVRLTVLRGNDQVHASLPLQPDRSTDGHAAAACGPGRRAEHTL